MDNQMTAKAIGAVVLTPSGNLLGGKESDLIESQIHQLATNGHKRIIVDLRNLALINSAGLRALEEGLLACKRNGAHMRVCNVGKRVTSFIVLWAFVRRFDVREDLLDALASFAPNTVRW